MFDRDELVLKGLVICPGDCLGRVQPGQALGSNIIKCKMNKIKAGVINFAGRVQERRTAYDYPTKPDESRVPRMDSAHIHHLLPA